MDRSLTDGQFADWVARFAALGFTLTVEQDAEPYGFCVQNGSEKYDYRYREGEGAADLLGRALAERGG